MKVVGTKVGSFVDKTTGELVSYSRLYVTYNFEPDERKDAPQVTGICAEELRVPVPVLQKVTLGDEIRPIYNKHGKVEDVDVLQHSEVKAEAGAASQEKVGKAG